jgi:hypothetical protein
MLCCFQCTCANRMDVHALLYLDLHRLQIKLVVEWMDHRYIELSLFSALYRPVVIPSIEFLSYLPVPAISTHMH